MVTDTKTLSVTSLVRDLIDSQGWKCRAQTSDAIYLWRSYKVLGKGTFTFNLNITTTDNGGRCVPGEFIRCCLYAPQTRAISGLVREPRPVSEWKTLKGANAGIPAAFQKAYTAFQSKVGQLVPM